MQNQRDFRIESSRLPGGGILFFGTNNVSMKRSRIRKLGIKFDESIKHSGIDMDFAAQIVGKEGLILFDRTIVVCGKERQNLISFLLQRYQRGTAPIKLKKRWPNLDFHFYNSAILRHLTGTYPKISWHLLKRARFIDFLRLPFILLFAIIAFEAGRARQLIISKER